MKPNSKEHFILLPLALACMFFQVLRIRLIGLLIVGAFFAGVGQSTALARDIVDPSVISAIEWRLIGPYRGGRVTTVTGVADNPLLYYMGATGGGVWKTENAGTTWQNISDGFFKVGTIGAVAVSESDGNVLYVGTGESPIRGVTTSHGDGVYKSEDAGNTWEHVGLEKSGQISRIKINPDNSDIAFVAVQGTIWGPSQERGIYRTSNGGKTWQQVLQVSENTGASDLAMDPSNPRILYAAMWNHGRKPWFIHSGGEDGGIFKTTDGGDTWTKLEDGLPKMIGKIGVDVSASNPNRVYAIVEAEPEKGGLYRSDNAGESWELINNHRVLHTRAWYYIHVTADPVDEDTVWVLNVPIMKSVDGGKTWEKKSTPHSDHHDHWINPNDNRNMVNGNDGGATITFDGGETWSSIMNQPTAQFYRVVTDNEVPYRIYGGQQDNSTVAIASRTYDRGIGVEDYYDVGGGESAHIAFDPDNPRLVYATTINGTLTEYDTNTLKTRSIIPYPEMVYGKDSRDLKYRSNWNAPVAMSPHDSSVVYYGTQKVLKSSDRGLTWSEISPDLTRNDVGKQGRNGGPLTPENVGAEFYNTVFYIVESPHEKDTIWAGSDDGLVHLTRDGGKSWSNVSPKHGSEAVVNAIEISPHDLGTVYIAVAGYKMNDFKPYIYRSTDYGKKWKRIDSGLPENTFVRVVREDPVRRGLLYAGTEAGMFVSFNDGADWQSLELNLPPVPITDLAIRQGNLVAATQGRAFWVLDDLTILRQAAAGLEKKPLHVFTPATAVMGFGSGTPANFEGANPPSGTPIYYYIRDEQNEEALLSIDILDAAGNLVRHYSSEESDFDRCRIGNMDPRRPFEIEYPTTDKGLNKWSWDLLDRELHCIDNISLFAGFSGPTVLPGTYKAQVSIGDATETVSFSVEADPRSQVSAEQTAQWGARITEVRTLIDEILLSLDGARKARGQIRALMDDYPAEGELHRAGEAAISNIGNWEALLTQLKHQTYEDEDAWESMLVAQLRYLMDGIDETGAPITGGAMDRIADLKAEWVTRRGELTDIVENDIEPLNALVRSKGIDHVTIPGR
jgi:photosystem II stability/assembly factor-like uncharacterized protein